MRLVPVNKGRVWYVDIGMPNPDIPSRPCKLGYCSSKRDIPKMLRK